MSSRLFSHPNDVFREVDDADRSALMALFIVFSFILRLRLVMGRSLQNCEMLLIIYSMRSLVFSP